MSSHSENSSVYFFKNWAISTYLTHFHQLHTVVFHHLEASDASSPYQPIRTYAQAQLNKYVNEKDSSVQITTVMTMTLIILEITMHKLLNSNRKSILEGTCFFISSNFGNKGTRRPPFYSGPCWKYAT